MICSNCQTTNKPDSKFCMGCGAPLIPPAPPQESPQAFQLYSPEQDAPQEAPPPPPPIVQPTASGPIQSPVQGEYQSYSPSGPQPVPPQQPAPQAFNAPFPAQGPKYPPPPPPPPPGQFSSQSQPYGQGPQGYAYSPAKPAAPKKNKTLWIILGAVAALLIICVVLFLTVLRPMITKAIRGAVDPVATFEIPGWTDDSEAEEPLEEPAPTEEPVGVVSVAGGVIDPSNANSVQQLARFGNGMAKTIHVSPDSLYLAVGTSIGLDIFELNSGQRIQHLLDDNIVYDALFLPDGKVIATTDDGIYLFSAGTFELMSTVAEEGRVYGLSMDADGTFFAADYGHKVNFYTQDGQSFSYSHTILENENFYAVEMSPNSDYLATGDHEGKLKIWKTYDGTLVHEIDAHTTYINKIAWTKNSALVAAASDDYEVSVWNADTGEELQRMKDENSGCETLAFSGDGEQLLTACEKAKVRVWDTMSGSEENSFTAESSFIKNITFSPDDEKLVALDDWGQIFIWGYPSAELIQKIGIYNDYFLSLAVSNDGSKIFFLDGDYESVMIDRSGNLLWTNRDDDADQILGPAFSHDGRTLIGGTYGGYVNFRDVNDGFENNYFDAHDDWIRSIAISPDETKIVTASDDNTLKVWDYNSFDLLFTLEGHSDYVRTVAFSPDGKLIASGGDDKTVRLWDANTGNLLNVLENHTDWVRAVNFSPDGRYLASTGDDSHVSIWDPATGELVRGIEVGATNKHSLAFTLDSQHIWVANASYLELFDIETQEAIVSLDQHKYNLLYFALSADGTTLVTTSLDGTLRIWGVK